MSTALPPPAPDRATTAEDAQSLDGVLLAVQKSISRVNGETAAHLRQRRTEDGEDFEVAMLDGPVSWAVQLSARLVGDKLIVDESGPLKVELAGQMSVPERRWEPPPRTDDGRDHVPS